MTTTRVVTVSGHIIDSLILTKILDLIVASGCEFNLGEVEVGQNPSDISSAHITITGPSDEVLDELVASLAVHGARPK